MYTTYLVMDLGQGEEDVTVEWSLYPPEPDVGFYRPFWELHAIYGHDDRRIDPETLTFEQRDYIDSEIDYRTWDVC